MNKDRVFFMRILQIKQYFFTLIIFIYGLKYLELHLIKIS